MSIVVIQQIRDELIECAAVSSTAEFCRCWLAKDESYIRVLRFHQLPASVDALATCASKLGYYQKFLSSSDKAEHKQMAETFQRLRALCVATMEQQARAKWMTPERMLR